MTQAQHPEAMATSETARVTYGELVAAMPSGTVSAIYADHREDVSDIQTDYFATHRTRSVLIGWSKSTRDSFSEMRKAAARFTETAEFGHGCDLYTVSVVFVSEGPGHCAGDVSRWHSSLYPDFDAPTFPTQTAADEWLSNQPLVPNTVQDGDVVYEFAWHVTRQSIEHREKYSMGAGYYLAHPWYRGGWRVNKSGLPTGNADEWLAVDVLASLLPERLRPRPVVAQLHTPASAGGAVM